MVLHALPHGDIPAIGSRHGAMEEQQVPLFIDLNDVDVLYRDTHVAELPGHFLALGGHTRGEACADRAAVTKVFVRTVATLETREVMALHDAAEAATLGGTDNINLLSDRKRIAGS